jgi:SNF2 family DNA or RNA helicase
LLLTFSSTTDDDEPEQDTPHKVKRKKKIYEDASARNMREQDRQRIAAQEERRKKLQAALALGDQNDQGDIIINESKLDDEGFIYVNEKIARRIKKHQIEGVRFMWNQVVTNDNALQGCLLAHTMGLGKTMQV